MKAILKEVQLWVVDNTWKILMEERINVITGIATSEKSTVKALYNGVEVVEVGVLNVVCS